MSVSYDENVIVQFAARLYRRAATIVVMYALLGAMLGGIAAAGLTVAVARRANELGGPAMAGAILCCIVGVVIGSERAFALRLAAQTALCQVQIERNTRPGRPGNVS